MKYLRITLLSTTLLKEYVVRNESDLANGSCIFLR